MYLHGGLCEAIGSTVTPRVSAVATQATFAKTVTEFSQLRTCIWKPLLVILSVHVSMRSGELWAASTPARTSATLGAVLKALGNTTSTHLSAPFLIGSCVSPPGPLPKASAPVCRLAVELHAIQAIVALQAMEPGHQLVQSGANPQLSPPWVSANKHRLASPDASNPDHPTQTSGVQGKCCGNLTNAVGFAAFSTKLVTSPGQEVSS